MHLQCDLFCKMSFVLFVLIGSLPQNPINHTKFSGRPYFGGAGAGKITMGETWIYEIRTIHYIIALPIGIFLWGTGETLSDNNYVPSGYMYRSMITYSFYQSA